MRWASHVIEILCENLVWRFLHLGTLGEVLCENLRMIEEDGYQVISYDYFGSRSEIISFGCTIQHHESGLGKVQLCK